MLKLLVWSPPWPGLDGTQPPWPWPVFGGERQALALEPVALLTSLSDGHPSCCHQWLVLLRAAVGSRFTGCTSVVFTTKTQLLLEKYTLYEYVSAENKAVSPNQLNNATTCLSEHYYKQGKKCSETQTLRAGCSKAEPKIPPRHRPLPGGTAGDGHYLYLQTQYGEDRCTQISSYRCTQISSYRGNRPTHKLTHPANQTGLITIHCAASSTQCNYTRK